MVLDHREPVDLGQPGPADGNLEVTIRPGAPDDVRYVVNTWLEEWKKSSPKLWSVPFGMWREFYGPKLSELVDHASILVATNQHNRILGWLAFERRQRISAIHYAYTRAVLHRETCPRGRGGDCGCSPERFRRRGIFSVLLEAANLGSRLVYTHRGAKPVQTRGGSKNNQRARIMSLANKPTLDLAMVEHLASKGITAVYVSLEEWRA